MSCLPFPQDDPRCLNVIEFDRLLRESQREVLRLQRQIALKTFKECLRPSKSPSGGAAPSAPARRGPPAPQRNPRAKGSPRPKEAGPGEPPLGGAARREVRQAAQQPEVLLLNYSMSVFRQLVAFAAVRTRGERGLCWCRSRAVSQPAGPRGC